MILYKENMRIEPHMTLMINILSVYLHLEGIHALI